MKKIVLNNKNSIKSKIEAYLKDNGELRFIHRLQVLHYMAENEQVSCQQVGKLFNTSPRAIFNWVNKVNQTGDIEVLKDQPGKGRKTKLTQAHKKTIAQALKKNPSSVGLSSDKWNGKLLSEYILQITGITLQERQCQRLLLKMGRSNERGRPKTGAV
jgi:transposase